MFDSYVDLVRIGRAVGGRAFHDNQSTYPTAATFERILRFEFVEDVHHRLWGLIFWQYPRVR